MTEEAEYDAPSCARIEEKSMVKCGICRDGQRPFDLSESNLLFLQKRVADSNLNEAIDIARIAWEQFPQIRQSADTKRIMESIMEGLQEKMNVQVLAPISSTTTAMTAIIDRLENLVDSNPSLIERGFNRTIEGFRSEMNNIRAAIQEPTAKISELNQLVNQLLYKPIAKGNAGETILTDLWTEHFTKDQIEKLGGAGREDMLVRPYLGGDNGTSHFGDAISIERKTGKQKYTGSHREEAIRHAKEKGASIAMLIYDSQENLPLIVRPVSISREQGILVVVSDLQSGSWKMMRETIEIIQTIMQHSNNKDIAAIDVDAIQEVATELGNMVKLVEQIKGNNAKIKSCAYEVEQSIVTIKALVKSYQERLQLAVTGANNGAVTASIQRSTADSK